VADPHDATLEERLVDLGRQLDVPDPADVAPAVFARLAQEPRRGLARVPRPGRRLRRRLVAVVAVVAVLLVGLTPAGQAAVARVAAVLGVVLERGEPQAPPRPEVLPGETASALDRARSQVGFPVVVPAALGTPDSVTVSDAGRVLSLVYGPGPGRPPAGPGGVSARLDEFDGTLDPVFSKTIDGPAEYVELPDGTFAIWISAPHDVSYVDATGTTRTEAAHLASSTLIWAVGPVTLRLEGDFTREQALAVAVTTGTRSS
jgi:hypothetical protein